MTKIIQLLLLVVSGTFLLSACNRELVGSGKIITEIRQMEPITAVENNGNFRVVIEQGELACLSLQGEDNVIPEIVTEVRHKKLMIWYRHYDMKHSHQEVVIHITTPDINLLSVSGSGSIESVSKWTARDLFTHVSGSGKIEVSTEAGSVKGNISGSGQIYLRGQAGKSDFTISGSGQIQAYELAVKDAVATVSGTGVARIKAENTLYSRVSESATVYYKGSPLILSSSVSGAGNVLKQ